MINRILEFSLRQRMFILMATAILIAVGLWSAVRLPMDAVPDITNVQVQINTSVEALAAEEIEKLITFPIETSMSGLQGLEEVRSISRFGLSQVPPPADTDVVGSGLAAAGCSDDVGEHRREQPVLVAAVSDALAGEAIDDAGAAASWAPLRDRLHESAVAEDAEMPADRVGVQSQAFGELVGVQAAALALERVEDHLPLPPAVHCFILPRTSHEGLRRNYRFGSTGLFLRSS